MATTLRAVSTEGGDRVLNRAESIVQAFRLLDPEIGAQTMAAFFAIARNQGSLTSGEIAASLGISLTNASRTVMMLSDEKDIPLNKNRPGDRRLGLVQTDEDGGDRRRKPLRLTTRGRNFANQIITIMTGGKD